MDDAPGDETRALARQLLLRRFRWSGGHADVWRVFTDGPALAAVIDGLVAPWRTSGTTHVAGIESRGFLLGGAAAIALGTGFVAIRKGQGLFPGMKVTATAAEDYRGQQHLLRMQRSVGPGDRVLLVDDWAERGSQALAARQLVEECGATWLGVSLMVDQLPAAVRLGLHPVTSLVQADELGDPDAEPVDDGRNL